jgi:hypothetical protein
VSDADTLPLALKAYLLAEEDPRWASAQAVLVGTPYLQSNLLVLLSAVATKYSVEVEYSRSLGVPGSTDYPESLFDIPGVGVLTGVIR